MPSSQHNKTCSRVVEVRPRPVTGCPDYKHPEKLSAGLAKVVFNQLEKTKATKRVGGQRKTDHSLDSTSTARTGRQRTCFSANQILGITSALKSKNCTRSCKHLGLLRHFFIVHYRGNNITLLLLLLLLLLRRTLSVAHEQFGAASSVCRGRHYVHKVVISQH